MKKSLLNLSFEFIFALGVIILLLLPPMVMAQQQPKELKVIIQNNDTTINGKNIKDLSANDRKKALKDINEVNITSAGNTKNFIAERDGKTVTHKFTFHRDSSGNRFDDRRPEGAMMRMNEKTPRPGFRFQYDDEEKGPHSIMNRINGGRNSQTFNYSSVNKDGFSTTVSYHVSDVNHETEKRISGSEKPELIIDDLLLNPSFSTGKTNLSFTLIEKGIAEVDFKDNDSKTLWTSKTSGTFSKSFDLPQNGIYYLQIKLGDKIALRRVIKEQ